MAHTITRVTLLAILTQLVSSRDIPILRSIRECIRGNSSLVCLKERALRVIDEALFSDQPLQVSEFVDIVRDPEYKINFTEEATLPRDLKQRSEKLNDLLTKRVDDFFESRTVKFKLAKVFEGIYKYLFGMVAGLYDDYFKSNGRGIYDYYSMFYAKFRKLLQRFIPYYMILDELFLI